MSESTRPDVIPEWIHHISEGHDSPLDQLHTLGFWDMGAGDWYANGQWNPRPWEMWEKFNGRYGFNVSDETLLPFARAIKRAYTAASPEETQALDDGFRQIFAIIESLATEGAAVKQKWDAHVARLDDLDRRVLDRGAAARDAIALHEFAGADPMRDEPPGRDA